MAKSLHEYRLERKFQQRLYVFTGLVFLAVLTFVFQLGNLQLVKGYENRILAKKFVSRQEFTVAPRGLVYDRNFKPGDKPIIENIRFIDFVIYPSRFKSREEAVQYVNTFCSVMGRDCGPFARNLVKTRWRQLVRRNESITLLNRMTRREQERLSSFHMAEKYGEFVTKHLRYYSMGPAASHVTGYIGLPTRRQLDQKMALSYQTLGKAGVESRYDSELRGTDGIRIRHRIINEEEEIAGTEQGNTLVLTIDRAVQAAGYRALINAGRRGAAVAINAGTGEIIALVSNPSFDPNILSSGTIEQRGKHFREVKRHNGFLNLTIQGKYPPASTFKPLVALAALERSPDRDITPMTSFSCFGSFTLKSTLASAPDTRYSCWTSGHGRLDMIGAIANSCNVYFYNLGYHIGSKPMIHFARAFGLDKKTGIDLPGEIEGRVPDSRWKQIHMSGAKWYDGDTINMAIGQGYLETTPIEMAVMYSGLINRGKLFRPHLLREIRDPLSNRLIRRMEPQLVSEVPVSPASLLAVQDGMRAVVTRGTARRLQQYAVPIAGKTGTAQTRSRVQGKNHAWFIGFAPFGAPPEETIVVAVFVEHGMGGGMAAAPVGGEMLNAAFPDWTPQRTRELTERRMMLEHQVNRAGYAAGDAEGELNGESPYSVLPDNNGAEYGTPGRATPPGFIPGQQIEPAIPPASQPEPTPGVNRPRLPIKTESRTGPGTRPEQSREESTGNGRLSL